MKIFATNKILSVTIFCVSLFFADVALANNAYGRNYTLPIPEDVRRIGPEKLRSISKQWDGNGIVRLAVISDQNFGYDFWSGVQFIDIKTEKIYNARAVECHISFCLYVGRIPSGKYFINKLYAHSYDPSKFYWRFGTTSAPVRNSMGSFEVKPWSITDLGLIGIHSDPVSVKKGEFTLSFLGHHPDISALYERLYRGYRKYLNFNDEIYGWDDGEWKDSAREKSPIEPAFFADFSRYHVFEGKLFFPSSVGTIYALDWHEGYSRYKVDTLFMLNALWVDGNRWIAGGEYGRIYVSDNGGKSWKTVDAFSNDEIVVRIFEREDKLYLLTVTQEQKSAKLYVRADDNFRFSLVSKTKFKLAGKSKGFAASMDGGQESLTKMYFNREDLQGIKVQLSGDYLVVQLNKRLFAVYGFGKNKWKTFKADKPIRVFSLNNDRIDMVAETHRISYGAASSYKGEKFRELPFEKRNKFNITSMYSYSVDSRKKLAEKDYIAISNGGFYLNKDGSRLVVMGLFESEEQLQKQPPPRIYSIGSDWTPVVMRPLENINFSSDSDLLPMSEDILLIDRVVPRVYRMKPDGSIDSHRLHERAYERLREIDERVEMQT